MRDLLDYAIETILIALTLGLGWLGWKMRRP